jgi:5'-nucleotidase
MLDRRHFLKKAGLGTMGIMTLSSFDMMELLNQNDLFCLTIAHTNDMHSHVDPFPSDHRKYPGMGGMARRATMVSELRKSNPHLLLLDSGDIFQGTPYFNFYGGEVELKLMSEMGYDCATMGNHDFDNGLDGFDKMLPFASFPFVTSNYDFSDTILHEKTHRYKTFQRGPVKIGVFGIGIQLDGLVSKPLYGNTIHNDEIETANLVALELKELGCDFIICLSHIGFKYADNRISDHDLAKHTANIDLILGGHTHTFLDKPVTFSNKKNKPVIVNQVGWAGLVLGKLDFYFDKSLKTKWCEQTSHLAHKNCAKKII